MNSSWQIVKDSISWVGRHIGSIGFVFTPLIVFFIITLILIAYNPLFILLNGFILSWFFTTGIVQIHRKIILDEEQSLKLFPRMESVYFKYFGLLCLFNFLNRILDKVSDAFTAQLESDYNHGLQILEIIFILVLTYLALRLYFVFPSISVGKPLYKVFSISQGRFWKIVTVSLLFFISLLIPITVIVGVIVYFSVNIPNLFPSIFFLLFFLGLMLWNVVFSFMLKEFSKYSENK